MRRRSNRHPRAGGKLPGSPWGRAMQRARTEGVTPMPQDRNHFRVQSSSHARFYDVVHESGGHFSCSCPAGQFNQPCKHVASIYLLGRRLDESYQWEAPWVGGTVPVAYQPREEDDDDPRSW